MIQTSQTLTIVLNVIHIINAVASAIQNPIGNECCLHRIIMDA